MVEIGIFKLWVENQGQWPKLSGKIPNILKLAKTSQFPGIVRFPDFQFPNSRNVGNLKFWVENQGQWPKLSGKNSPYFEIGQN